jgi:hypothetical protein
LLFIARIRSFNPHGHAGADPYAGRDGAWGRSLEPVRAKENAIQSDKLIRNVHLSEQIS